MEQVIYEHTLDKARRLVRCQMQCYLCQTKKDESGPEVAMWEQAVWLATSFYENAKVEWVEWLSTTPIPDSTLSSIIVQAVVAAKSTAAEPYQEKLGPAWVETTLGRFMQSFNPHNLQLSKLVPSK